jgi:hypothetical protein
MAIDSNIYYVDGTNPSFTLNTGSGPRIFKDYISFSQMFASIPRVVLGLTHIDATGATAVRMDISAPSVNREGFTIEIQTWDDSLVFGICLHWLAHEEN